jgi:hypothetical protein
VINATDGIMHHVQGAVRFGDDVAKGSPMQESLSSGSRVDALLRASEHDAALLRASELDI